MLNSKQLTIEQSKTTIKSSQVYSYSPKAPILALQLSIASFIPCKLENFLVLLQIFFYYCAVNPYESQSNELL